MSVDLLAPSRTGPRISTPALSQDQYCSTLSLASAAMGPVLTAASPMDRLSTIPTRSGQDLRSLIIASIDKSTIRGP